MDQNQTHSEAETDENVIELTAEELGQIAGGCSGKHFD